MYELKEMINIYVKQYPERQLLANIFQNELFQQSNDDYSEKEDTYQANFTTKGK